MFKILGADGKEYGPVAADQIKQWIRESRANGDTQAQKTGDFNWRPLAQYPEFAEALGLPPPVAPAAPAVPAAPAAPAPAPSFHEPTPVADGRERARRLVTPAAVGMIVAAGIDLLVTLVGLLMQIMTWGVAPRLPAVPGLPPEMLKVLVMLSGPVGLVIRLVALVIGILMLAGAIKMLRFSNRGLAITAAILAIIPCFHGCCLVSLPFGVWALVVLCKDEVKSHFS